MASSCAERDESDMAHQDHFFRRADYAVRDESRRVQYRCRAAGSRPATAAGQPGAGARPRTGVPRPGGARRTSRAAARSGLASDVRQLDPALLVGRWCTKPEHVPDGRAHHRLGGVRAVPGLVELPPGDGQARRQLWLVHQP
jgi:hypothetical protein